MDENTEPNMTMAATVIRANGDIEELGVIAEGTASFTPASGEPDEED